MDRYSVHNSFLRAKIKVVPGGSRSNCQRLRRLTNTGSPKQAESTFGKAHCAMLLIVLAGGRSWKGLLGPGSTMRNVFLVEDEALIRMMTAGMVEELGHRVIAEAA